MDNRRYLLHVLDVQECLIGYGALQITVDGDAAERFRKWRAAVGAVDPPSDLSHMAFYDDVSALWLSRIEDSELHDKLYEKGVLEWPNGEQPPGTELDVDSSLAVATRDGLAWEARLGSNVIETMEYIPWATLLGE